MKLHLPHKFQAALMAAIASVSVTTLSSGTIAVATGTAILAGQQAYATDKYTKPQTGSGPAYTWVTDHWENSSGEEVIPARSDNKGPVLNVDNSGSAEYSGDMCDTSDYGGINVTGNSNFTTKLGGWAGFIYVGEGSALTASFTQKLKSMEPTTAANVYVDGTLAITNSGGLNINDGDSDQNWYIGEQGFINLSNATSVNKKNAWNIQLSVPEGEVIDITEYAHRTLGETTVTKDFMSTGADLFNQVNSWSVYCGDQELEQGADKEYVINHNASGMSVTYKLANGIQKLTLTWKGGTGTWAEKDSSMWLKDGVATSFVNGDDVVFSGMGDVAQLAGAIKAGVVSISGSATIDASAEGSSLAVQDIAFTGENSELTLTGNGAVTASSLTFRDNATLTVSTGAGMSAGNLNVAESKTAGIAGAGSISVGSLSLGGGAGVDVADGASLTITGKLNNFQGKVTGGGALHLNLDTNAEGAGDGRIMLADGSNIKDIYI